MPGQLAAYGHAIDNYRDIARWCAFIDGDEFLVPQSELSVPDVPRYFDPICTGLYVHWHMFGSSGLTQRGDGPVTQTFRRRGHSSFGPNTIGKTIVKPRHAVGVPACHIIRSDGPLINDSEDVIDQSRGGLHIGMSHRFIALNHDYTKSLGEWDERRSLGKADKCPDDPDFRRQRQDFHAHDINDVADNRAADLMCLAALAEARAGS